jgi:hypothetical protein
MLVKATEQSQTNLGEHVITGGLGIQVVFFGFFIIVAGIFHHRIARFPTTRLQSLSIPWERYLFVLYGASLAVIICPFIESILFISCSLSSFSVCYEQLADSPIETPNHGIHTSDYEFLDG